MVVTSGVWDVIERRKRERTELEQAVKRKEMAAAREGVEVSAAERAGEKAREREKEKLERRRNAEKG